MGVRKSRVRKVDISAGFPKELLADPRITRDIGILKCIQCGRCTAGCPAASVYEDFSPRDVMQKLNTGQFESLLTGDVIWRCGQCYTCHSRCPRGNSPATVILALREISVKKGFTTTRAEDINSGLIHNFLEKGESMSPDAVTSQFQDTFGPEVRELWKMMPGLRRKMGYDEKSGRRERVPGGVLIELRILLEAIGFPRKIKAHGKSHEKIVEESQRGRLGTG
jgi:heterodisulfide reductase subunit C